MSSRPGVAVSVEHKADQGDSPNRYYGGVSIHIRAYWPPLATDEEIQGAIRDANARLLVEIAQKRDEVQATWSKLAPVVSA